jgi:hypothetical protein
MTLTPAKLTHLTATIRRSWAGRSQLVDLTCRQSGGSTTVLTVPAIWRVIQDADPSLEPAYGESAAAYADADIQAVFLLADLTYHQLRSCISAQLHPGEGIGMQPATTFTLTNIQLRGLQPGGSRFLTLWVRATP